MKPFWKIRNRLNAGSWRSHRRRGGPHPTGALSLSRWTGRASARRCRSSTVSLTGWFKPGILRAIPLLCGAASPWRDPPRPAGFCLTNTGRKCVRRLKPSPPARLGLPFKRPVPVAFLTSLHRGPADFGGLPQLDERFLLETGNRRPGALVAEDSGQSPKNPSYPGHRRAGI